MGTLKIHNGALAIQSMGLINDTSANPRTTCNFKLLGGDSCNTLYGSEMKNYCFTGLNARATADLLKNYSIEDYSVVTIGTKTVLNDTANHIYGYSDVFTVTVSNTGSESITVGCIRFYKNVKVHYSLSGDVLVYSYYLDKPLTIEPGDTQSVSVTLKISNSEIN